MFTIELRIVIYLQHIVSFLRYMAFWCQFLELDLITYHSNKGGADDSRGLSRKQNSLFSNCHN